MKILVTAGNTQVPIDRVRCITNIFTGRTGGRIALQALQRGHDVTLLTSHPEVIPDLAGTLPLPPERWRVQPYRYFDDLDRLMRQEIGGGAYSAVIHSAAVSDFLCTGIFAPAENTTFDQKDLVWQQAQGRSPALRDVQAGKVKSDTAELWVRFERAPKLVDRIRQDWGFGGVLVKFKLEVGVSEPELLEIAERSRTHSQAELLAANTLEGSHEWAYLGPLQGVYQRLTRAELPARLLEAVEELHQERSHG